MGYEITGGKDHQAAFLNEYSLGNVPDGTTASYPGLMAEIKASTGLQLQTLTGLGSRTPQGWAGSGYIPELALTIKAAGPRFYNLMEPHLADSFNDNYSSQAWEVWKDDQGGYDGALLMAGVAKSMNLIKNSLPEPLQLQLQLVGQYLQHTTTKTGTGGGSYQGFKGTASNPLTIEHPTVEPIPWLGAHVKEQLKFKGESAVYPAPMKSWQLALSRDIQPILGQITGADGDTYVVPRVFSWQKTTITMTMTMSAQDWDLWQRSYEEQGVDWVELQFIPPAGLSSNPGNKTLKLLDGVLKPMDLDIKELAALDIPMTMEFKGVQLI